VDAGAQPGAPDAGPADAASDDPIPDEPPPSREASAPRLPGPAADAGLRNDYQLPDEEVIVTGVLEGGGCACGVVGDRRSPAHPGGFGLLLLGLGLIGRRTAHRRDAARSGRSFAWLALVFGLGVVGSPRPAHAQNQGFAINRYEPATHGSEWFAGESLDFRGHGRWAVGGVWDVGIKPLVAYDDNGDELATIINSQIYTHIGGGVLLWEASRLGFNIPILWYQDGTPTNLNGVTFATQDGLALGDVRLEADVRLLGHYEDPFRLALAGHFHLPTGSRDSFTGDGGVRFTPRVAIAGDINSFAYSGNVRTTLRTQTDNFADEPFGADLGFGATAGLRFVDKRWLIGPELWGSTVISDSGDGLFARRTTPVEATLAAHYAERGWRFGLGIGPGFTRGLGTPQLRILASASWVAEVEEPIAPPADSDEDGIFDRDDACAEEPGPSHVDPRKHGCPLPPPPDTDGDGIADRDDACVREPGVYHQDRAKHGCPAPKDRDEDGIWDDDDACVDEPGVASNDRRKHGCPLPGDGDGDGILDTLDACPDKPGPVNTDPEQNGCPRATVTESQIIILDRVEFDTNKATIKPQSDTILEAVLSVLTEYPAIEELQVEGHTDDRGSHRHNLELSADRAAAVVEWLVARGVSPNRLVSKGFGPDKPIAPNETDEGRQQNRRVEFHILKQQKSAESEN
jgi:outer membrane protein OmpA-like peptidoglycan-associated protein